MLRSIRLRALSANNNENRAEIGTRALVHDSFASIRSACLGTGCTTRIVYGVTVTLNRKRRNINRRNCWPLSSAGINEMWNIKGYKIWRCKWNTSGNFYYSEAETLSFDSHRVSQHVSNNTYSALISYTFRKMIHVPRWSYIVYQWCNKFILLYSKWKSKAVGWLY